MLSGFRQEFTGLLDDLPDETGDDASTSAPASADG
jgi:hypothetical protein